MAFIVTLEGLDELEAERLRMMRDLDLGIRKAVVLSAQEGVQEGKKGGWQDRTGEARKTIHSRLVRDQFALTEADMIAPLGYHEYLDRGTAPHDIRPVRAKALRFYIGETLIFARRVHHPGTKGFGFAGSMWFKAERVLRAELELTVSRIVERWNG